MGIFDKIENEEKKLKERKIKNRRPNPFDNVIFEEGEFVTIKPLVYTEPIVEEEEDGSTNNNIGVSAK